MTLELLRLPGLQYSSEHKTLVASPALLSNTDVIVPLLKLAARRLSRSNRTKWGSGTCLISFTCLTPNFFRFEIYVFGF